MKEKIRRRRKKYFHETVNALIILLLLCHVQVSKSQRTTYNGDDNGEDDLRRKSGFLYVPPGKGVDEGIILHEITQDQLPPGEYEIVAKFQDPSEAVESPFQTAASRYDVQGDYHYHDESPFKSLPRRTHHHPPIYNYDYGPLVTPRPTYVVPTPQTTPKRKFQHFPERPKSSHGGSIEEAKRMIYPPDHEQQRISELPAVKKQQRFPPQPPPPSRQENFYPLPHPPPRVQDEEEIYYPLPRVEKDVSLRHHYRHQTSSRYREEDSASGSKGERFHNSNDLQLYFPKHHQQYSPVATENQMPISVYSSMSHSKEVAPARPTRPTKPARKVHYRPPPYPELEEMQHHYPQPEPAVPERHSSRYRTTSSYDPRQRQESKQQEMSLDHWAGYPGYPEDHQRRFAHVTPTQVYVTPLPKKKKKQFKKSAEYRATRPDLMTKKRANADELKKLYDIAGNDRQNSISDDFKCPRDGHYGDSIDCAKFYRCAHGKAHVEYCQGGLYWNSVTDQCDWPETVDCSYNAANLAAFRAKEPTTIYLTFDDGPNEGTDAILKALRNEGVKATFFVNSQYLHHPNKQKSAQNALNILTMVHDGHTIADHSYDHMYHNSKNSPKNAYTDVDEDLKYFGIMNIYPVLDVLWKADMKKYIGRVNHTMTYNVRMPYTNNWRVSPNYRRDCQACTVPASSGLKGIEIADSLHASDKQVFGWDLEWEIDWNRNRFKHGGKEMFFRMARDNPWAVQKGKIVILSHDIAHRPYEKRDEQRELEVFIRMAKEAGYKFDTIDNYSI